ncbi:MAG: hypothetical protein ACRDL6_10180 [Solirubrobacterales bacterium]
MPSRSLLVIASAALLSAGCGGEEPDSSEVPGGADPEAVEVIDRWSDELRGGDVEGAAAYWEVPSVAQNGTPPLELVSRDDVVAFNESLPCGAELIRAESEEERTVATFELTERPGPGECGPGTGETAKTAFVIEDEKIVEWLRVPDEPLPAPEGPVV